METTRGPVGRKRSLPEEPVSQRSPLFCLHSAPCTGFRAATRWGIRVQSKDLASPQYGRQRPLTAGMPAGKGRAHGPLFAYMGTMAGCLDHENGRNEHRGDRGEHEVVEVGRVVETVVARVGHGKRRNVGPIGRANGRARSTGRGILPQSVPASSRGSDREGDLLGSGAPVNRQVRATSETTR